jgi:pimeloyl-ACP methyl ester carboxylesterase
MGRPARGRCRQPIANAHALPDCDGGVLRAASYMHARVVRLPEVGHFPALEATAQMIAILE